MSGYSTLMSAIAAAVAKSCATMNAGASAGRMPANVAADGERDRRCSA